MAEQRLQKILAQAGVASRRAAEQLITQGRVRVNGRIVSELGARANPVRDRVEVDGRRLVAERPVYFLMHKPRGVVTTLDDPEGRKSVKDLLRGITERLFPVGRLDFQTSGALLLTNDGAMAQALLHPTRVVPKTYHAKIEGTLDDKRLELLRSGVTLDDGERTAPAEVQIQRKDDKHTFIEVTISEGKNRQIHRMLDAVGRVVLRLTRIAFAELPLEGLRPGQMRPLTTAELSDLKEKYLNPSKALARSRRARGTGRGLVSPEELVPPLTFDEQDEEPPRPPEHAPRGAVGRESSSSSRGRARQPEQARIGARGVPPRRDRAADGSGAGAQKVGARDHGPVRQRGRDASERVEDARDPRKRTARAHGARGERDKRDERVEHGRGDVSGAKRSHAARVVEPRGRDNVRGAKRLQTARIVDPRGRDDVSGAKRLQTARIVEPRGRGNVSGTKRLQAARIVEPRGRVDATTQRRGRRLDAKGRDREDERTRAVDPRDRARDPRAKRQTVTARSTHNTGAKRQRRR